MHLFLQRISMVRIYHGEAIAFGMICAAEIANRLDLFDKTSLYRLINLVKEFHLPLKLSGLNLGQILKALKHDKKFISVRNRFVLPLKIGKVVIRENIPTELIRRVISERLA